MFKGPLQTGQRVRHWEHNQWRTGAVDGELWDSFTIVKWTNGRRTIHRTETICRSDCWIVHPAAEANNVNQ